MNLKQYIDEIPDFPKKGINFKDISPLLSDQNALNFVINNFELSVGNPTKIVGLDARGFIFGSLLANKMGIPFVMIRKKGKLPGECEQISYDLEYGSNCFEIQKKLLSNGDRVAIIDDLLATGGSAKAACELVEKLGAYVESVNFVIELEFLDARKLFNYTINSLIKY